MIDTHCRKYASGFFDKVADVFIKMSLTPNFVTVCALILGIFASFCFLIHHTILATIFLWLSGLFDVIDGQMARKLKLSSDFGALMDITFDRIVEIGFIVVCAIKLPDIRLELIFLSCSIILSMTVFLTVGALSCKQSEKAFYYQAGLMERTETFIVFTIIMFFPWAAKYIVIAFTIGILFTAGQRLYEAWKLMGNK